MKTTKAGRLPRFIAALLFTALVGVTLPLNGCSCRGTSAGGVNPGGFSPGGIGVRSYTIAFVSDRDGNEEIYTITSGKDLPTRLTDSPQADRFPTWSPDGKKIVFLRRNDIWVMNRDGSGAKRLTDMGSIISAMALSPDGERIAFQRLNDIYMMNADGSGRIKIADSAGSRPVWSPDGSMIAFEGYDEEGSAGLSRYIYVADVDGTYVSIMSKGIDYPHGPAWSLDSSKLAYASADGIWMVNINNRSIKRKISNNTSAIGLVWSPDGNKIIYTYKPLQTSSVPYGDIWVMNANGSDATQLTDIDYLSKVAQWSSDGTRIAFAHYYDGAPEIYVMNADGTELTNVSDHPAGDHSPSWSP